MHFAEKETKSTQGSDGSAIACAAKEEWVAKCFADEPRQGHPQGWGLWKAHGPEAGICKHKVACVFKGLHQN